MLTCPNPPPVTLICDPNDDLAHTRAALIAHHPEAGRITVHPTPGTDSTTTLAYDILASLNKPVPFPGHRPHLDTDVAWTTAAAWILGTGITHLTLLRGHLLTPRRWHDLLNLRRRTGLRLLIVVHRATPPPSAHRALATVEYRLAEAAALLPGDASPRARPAAPAPVRAPVNRWITLPALITLDALDRTEDRCRCSAPAAVERDFRPPEMTASTAAEVAHRLHTATAYPHLAAALATAVFTAAATTQLATIHTTDLAGGATTVTLHDRSNLRQGCLTHPVPPWARGLLASAACLQWIAADTDRPLFADPFHRPGMPHLIDFAETCKLRPPQLPHSTRRTKNPKKALWPLSNASYHYRWGPPR